MYPLVNVQYVCVCVVSAHDNKVEERIDDYQKIISTLDLPKLINRQYKSDGKWLSFHCDITRQCCHT